MLIATMASATAAAASIAVLPPKQTAMMADPMFDSTAFYDTHLTTRASRDNARASYPGQQEQPPPQPPAPVAGLSQSQTINAYIIVEVATTMGLPKRAAVVAIATSLQETNLRNLANPKVAASLKYPHEGTGTNYDSLGLFQQRPSMGWGTVAQLMDPSQSAARFYSRLMQVSGWPSMSVASAAQAVQRSAFPTAYAKHATVAQEIVDALTKTSTSA
jgi:hypothetical protein